jgi:hypothetical protein
MLSELQVNIIVCLAAAIRVGLLFGALPGMLTAAVINIHRTRRIPAFLAGMFYAALPSARAAIAVSIVFTIFEMVVYKPGEKGGWDVPDLVFGMQVAAACVAGITAGLYAQRARRTRPSSGGRLAWASLGAVLGALACFPAGLEGYFVKESNTDPIFAATIGFAVGGFVVMSWHFLVARLHEKMDEWMFQAKAS